MRYMSAHQICKQTIENKTNHTHTDYDRTQKCHHQFLNRILKSGFDLKKPKNCVIKLESSNKASDVFRNKQIQL